MAEQIKKQEIRIEIDPEVFPEVCVLLGNMKQRKKRGPLMIRVFHDYVMQLSNNQQKKTIIINDENLNVLYEDEENDNTNSGFDIGAFDSQIKSNEYSN